MYMAQLAIYIDDELAARLEAVAKKRGVSRSRLVSDVLREQLADELPDSFFNVLGTWEDERKTKEIVEDIRDLRDAESRRALR